MSDSGPSPVSTCDIQIKNESIDIDEGNDAGSGDGELELKQELDDSLPSSTEPSIAIKQENDIEDDEVKSCYIWLKDNPGQHLVEEPITSLQDYIDGKISVVIVRNEAIMQNRPKTGAERSRAWRERKRTQRPPKNSKAIMQNQLKTNPDGTRKWREIKPAKGPTMNSEAVMPNQPKTNAECARKWHEIKPAITQPIDIEAIMRSKMNAELKARRDRKRTLRPRKQKILTAAAIYAREYRARQKAREKERQKAREKERQKAKEKPKQKLDSAVPSV